MWNSILVLGMGCRGRGQFPFTCPSAVEEMLTTTVRFLYPHRVRRRRSIDQHFAVQAVRWDRCPIVSAHPCAARG